MKAPLILVFALLTVLTGCHTATSQGTDLVAALVNYNGPAPTPEQKKANQEFYDTMMQLMIGGVSTLPVDTAVLRSGVSDVVFCSGSFYHKNGRWPTNYAELSDFVAHSNGYLMMSDHPSTQLQTVPTNVLQIAYAPFGSTNRIVKFNIIGPTASDTNSSTTLSP